MRKQFQELEVKYLPSMPHVLLKTLLTSRNPLVTVEQLCECIALDAALTARMVSVSSAASTFRDGQVTLYSVIEQLGLETTKRIITATALQYFFNDQNPAKNLFLINQWKHSVTTACAARLIAQALSTVDAQEAYLAGLIHDLGQLIFVENFGSEYLGVVSQSEGGDVEATEQVRFGLTHREMGAWYIGQWGLSGFTADAVLYHHSAVDEIRDAHSLVKIVYLAEKIASSKLQYNTEAVRIGEKLFGFTPQFMEKVIDQAGEEIHQFADGLGIDVNVEGYFETTDSSDELNDLAAGADQSILVKGFLELRSELALQLHGIGLIDGVAHQYSRIKGGDEALLQSIVRNGCVLFGLKPGFLFLYNQDDQRVRGVASFHSAIAGLEVPLTSGRSLITDAIIENKIFYGFLDDPGSLNVIDKQIIGLGGGEGIICIPLVEKDEQSEIPLGVLVYGFERQQLVSFDTNKSLMENFANESSIALHRNYLSQSQEQQLVLQERAIFQSRLKGISHEANNPLNIIQHYLQVLALKLDENHEAQKELTIIREEISRTVNIISSISALETEPQCLSGSVDINRVIEGLIAIQSPLFEANGVDVQLELDSTIPTLEMDADKLKQVVTNLVKNALEELVEKQDDSQLEEQDVFFQPRVSVITRDSVFINGVNCVEVCVSDNGRGIQSSVLETLFKPVRSKKGNNHQGLGLSIVNELVDALDGFISCQSRANEGTTFRVYLKRRTSKVS